MDFSEEDALHYYPNIRKLLYYVADDGVFSSPANDRFTNPTWEGTHGYPYSNLPNRHVGQGPCR